MDDVLLELLAARASSQGNAGMAELLARLRGAGADTNQITQEVITELSTRNPALSQFATRLAELQRSRVIDVEPDDNGADTPAPEYAESAIKDLKQTARDLLSEVEALRDRADQLAAALGACCACWGEDVSCRMCRGRGAPGFTLPDEALFEHYVLPAVFMLRGQKLRRQKRQSE